MKAETLNLNTYTEPDLSWGDFLVECPNCRQCAKVKTRSQAQNESFRLLTCTSCGTAKRYHTNSSYKASSEVEGCFETPFWLHTNCAGHKLWAVNQEHLEYLETYIAEKNRHEHRFHANLTVASRLPEWMVIGKNRDEVMHGLSKLRRKLDSVH